ncbi:MAG: hypothetical protein RLZZ262_1139, partial [Bacteroidota bacterium]
NLPIAVIQYMEGVVCSFDGDPAMVVVDDVTKKIDRITFATVESTVIDEHYLNLVINSEQLGNVALDGVIVNPSLFESFPNCDDQLWCALPISEGSHLLEAPGGGVTAYVYGYGAAESYAYSVGSFSPMPPIVIDEAICTNNGVTLQISNNLFDPIWFNYNEPETILYTGSTWEMPMPIENGVYVGQGNEFASGCETPFYFSVEIPEPPVFTISPDLVLCKYESAPLQINAFPENAVYLYNWSPTAGLSNPNIPNPVVTPTNSTTYTCTLTTLSGCASAVGTVNVTVQNGDITSFEITEEEVMFCSGENADLNIITEAEIWSDDFDPGVAWGSWEDITNGNASDVCGSVNDQALYFNGSVTREAITNGINVTTGGTIYFSLKIADGLAPCENADPGDNVVLSYSVSNGPWIVINTYYEAGYPEFTSIEVPIPAGAYSTNTRFRWHQTGLWLNNQDNWALDNVYVGTIQTNSYSYTWSPAAGLDFTSQPEVNASPTSTTMYYAEMVDAVFGCTYIDSILVNVGQEFTLDMPDNALLCDADGIQLYATPSIDGEYDYVWSPGFEIDNIFSPTPNVTPAETTTYTVEVTSEQGCTNTGSVTVNVADVLDLTLNASDVDICEGQDVTLTASILDSQPGVNLEWSPAGTLASPATSTTLASPTATTTYVCTVTIQEVCTLTEEITILVQPAFTVVATPDDYTDCVIEGLAIEATANVNSQLNWQWTPANLVVNPNLPSTSVNQDTSSDLIIVATNSAGCTASDTIYLEQIIEYINLPEIIEVCEDEPVTLDCGQPATHTIEWTNGLSTPSITVTTSNTYGVTATSPEGCVSQDQCEVIFYTYPPMPTLEDTTICAPDIVTLNAETGTYNYSWSTDETTPVIHVSDPGYYEVTIDNGFCFTTTGMTLNVNPLPINPFGPDPIIACLFYPPFGVELDAINPDAAYLWNTGETTPNILATEEGAYSVTITTQEGCEATFTQAIENVCPSTIYVPNSFTPNGDGTNDYWAVTGDHIGVLQVSIFNRWGEIFYQSNEVDFKWIGQRRDGEFFVEAGTYPYIIKVQMRNEKGELEEEKELKGFVTLIR